MILIAINMIVSYMALFLAAVMCFKKNKHVSDYYLVLWLLVFFAFILCKLGDSPLSSTMGRLLSAPHGIILFLYIKNITFNVRFLLKDLLYFVPFGIILLPAFFVDNYLFTILYQSLKLVMFVAYIILSILMLRKYRRSIKENYSNVENADVSWLRTLVYGILFFVINNMVLMLFPEYPVRLIEDIALFVFLTVMGIKGGLRAVVFIQPPPQKVDVVTAERKVAYANYGLKGLEVERLSERLREYMEQKRPYLNPILSLKDLAEAMDTYPHYVTQVLNTVFNQSFYDFVNQYRIEEAERQLTNPSNAKLTILAIAYDCGFNSKATFNRVFKEKKGITPTEHKHAVQ